MLDPAAAKAAESVGPLGGVVGGGRGRVLAVEAGAISGFLAGRVLGQYEFPVLDADAPARLLFVAPNLGHAATTLDAEPDRLLRWVALHEITHALQFGGVPWLRPHLAGMVRELTAALDLDPGKLFSGVPGLDDLRGLVDRVRDDGLAAVVLGPERRAQMDGIQAFMAVLEGYAEHVMDAVGADVIDDLPRLRAALERRRADRTGLLRLFEKLIGMDMKLRQYEQGKRFCDGVVDAGRHRRRSTACGRARPAADARRARRPGRLARAHRAGRGVVAALDRRSEPVPPAGRSARGAPMRHTVTQDERAFRMSQSPDAFTACSRGIPGSCNKDGVRFTNMCSTDGHRTSLVLSSIE